MPFFQTKLYRLISRLIVPLLLIGIGILCYSNTHKETPYVFPFSEEEIEKIVFSSIIDNDEILVESEADIESLFNLLKKMRVIEPLSDNDAKEPANPPLGGHGYILTVYTKSSNSVTFEYYQQGRTAYGGHGIIFDGSCKYSVNNLDLTRIWLTLHTE